MRAPLKFYLLLGAATIAAQMTLPACSDDGSDNDGTGDAGDSDGAGDAGGDTGGETDIDTGMDTIGLPFVASCGDQIRSGAGFEYTVCSEYFFEENATLEQDSQTNCGITGGTWSEERCPTADSNGSCTTVGDATTVQYYYGLPESEITARQSTCEQLGNTWTAP